MKSDLIDVVIPKPSALMVTKTLIGQADDLAREHEEFTDRYIVSGHKALYELLAKIYELAEKLDKCIDRDDQVRLLKGVLSQKYGIRTQENTSDTTVLVRYITQADRKTAHVYARAIEVARMNKIDSSNFSAYVQQAGGIERIRSESIPSVLISDDFAENKRSKEKRFELARKYLTARSEIPLASFKIGKRYLNTSKTVAFKQFVCYERNGRYFVLAEQEVEKRQELKLLEQIADKFCTDLQRATKGIDAFYDKAMLKRKRRTIKEISKKHPEIANRVRIALS